MRRGGLGGRGGGRLGSGRGGKVGFYVVSWLEEYSFEGL